MRKFLEQILEKTELIANTGHSYLMFSDFENLKYTEMHLPPEDRQSPNTEKHYSGISPSDIMTGSEVEEVYALTEQVKEHGIPFTLGGFENGEFTVYGNDSQSLLVLDLIERVQEYHKHKREEREELKEIKEREDSSPAVETECPQWRKLTDDQKKVIIKVIDDIVAANEIREGKRERSDT